MAAKSDSVDVDLRMLVELAKRKENAVISSDSIRLALKIGRELGLCPSDKYFVPYTFPENDDEDVFRYIVLSGFEPGSLDPEKFPVKIEYGLPSGSERLVENGISKEILSNLPYLAVDSGDRLVTTITKFKGEWENQFETNLSCMRRFWGKNGPKKAKFMCSIYDTLWNRSKNFFSVVKYFRWSGVRAILTKPTKRDPTSPILTKDNVKEYKEKHLLCEDWKESEKLTILVPHFEISSSYPRKVGMDKICDIDGSPIYWDHTAHLCMFELNHKGAEGIGFSQKTIMAGPESDSEDDGEEKIEWCADQPFMFSLVDENNSIIFSGIVDITCEGVKLDFEDDPDLDCCYDSCPDTDDEIEFDEKSLKELAASKERNQNLEREKSDLVESSKRRLVELQKTNQRLTNANEEYRKQLASAQSRINQLEEDNRSLLGRAVELKQVERQRNLFLSENQKLKRELSEKQKGGFFSMFSK